MPDEIGDELLRGAPPQAAHLPLLLSLLGDARVGRTLGGTRAEPAVRALLERWSGVWTERGYGPWLFWLRRPEEFVGYAGLAPADSVEPGAVELLYALRPERWGRGLATRASALALAHARAQGVAEAICFTLTTNHASQGVMRKLGFVPERVFEHAGAPHVLHRLSL